MDEKTKHLPRASTVYKQVATLGYNGAVEWYMQETHFDVVISAFKVSRKLLDASLEEVKDLIDLDVCRGIWRKYLSDAQIAEMISDIMKAKPLQRHYQLSSYLEQLNIPGSEVYLLVNACYYVFPELRNLSKFNDNLWIRDRLQIIQTEAPKNEEEIHGELDENSPEDVQPSKATHHSRDMIWYSIIALVCCAIACAICNGWDLTGIDKPDGMFRNPGLKWVVASIAGFIVWLVTLAVGESYWVPKVKFNPVYILLMIPVLIGGSIVFGYIAHLIAFLIVMLFGLILTLFGFIFTMFT